MSFEYSCEMCGDTLGFEATVACEADGYAVCEVCAHEDSDSYGAFDLVDAGAGFDW